MENEHRGGAGKRIIARFGHFELDWHRGELFRAGQRVEIQGRPFGLLCCLVRNAPRIVATAELRRAVWGDVVVSAWAVSSALRDLRRALSDNDGAQPIVRTYRGRGYRLALDVHERVSGALPPDPFTHTLVTQGASSEVATQWPQNEILERIHALAQECQNLMARAALIGGRLECAAPAEARSLRADQAEESLTEVRSERLRSVRRRDIDCRRLPCLLIRAAVLERLKAIGHVAACRTSDHGPQDQPGARNGVT